MSHERDGNERDRPKSRVGMPFAHGRAMRSEAAFFLSATLLVTGCTVAKMRPDPSLAKANVWPVNVEGGLFSDDAIAFGPFRAANIDRSWKSSSGSSTGPVTSTSSRQTWSFALGALQVSCTYRAGETSVAIGSSTFTSTQGEHMICETIRGGERGVVAVSLNGSGWSGAIRHAGYELPISSRHELEGSATTFQPAGYDIKDQGSVFASIQTINSPTVWMNTVDQAKQELAAAALVSVYYLEKVPRHH